MAEKYICLTCHSKFNEPICRVDDSQEYGRTATRYCPYCGEGDYFVEADDCPKCGETKYADDRLCTNCRTRLRAKFRRFRDNLTPAEEEVLDDWLDGESIKSI